MLNHYRPQLQARPRRVELCCQRSSARVPPTKLRDRRNSAQKLSRNDQAYKVGLAVKIHGAIAVIPKCYRSVLLDDLAFSNSIANALVL